MKSLRWYAILSAGAVLFSVTAGAQLQKGNGGGNRPPSSPPQSGGGRETPKPRENPPKSDGGRETPKPKENPPQSGGGREAPKPRENPPQSGGGREVPKPRENPPQSGGGREVPKPRENPPQAGGGTTPRENPITRGDNPPSGGGRENPVSNPPVRGGNGPTGVKQGSEQLGRIPRNGRGGYDGSVNNSNNGRGRIEPVIIRGAPSSQSLANLVLREDNPRKRGNIYDNSWRNGYYHYNNDWCDDYFWSNRYVFSPWSTRCVVSPWYYYSSLPGYLNYNCIRIISIPIVIWRGNDYRYNRYDSWNGRSYNNNRSDVDYAIDDIVKAFENQDRRALGRLISGKDRIHIYSNGNYDYSLESDDFYDLMLDGIYNSKTRSYEIESVKTYRDEAEVVARHEYTDPWGRRTSVYHWYRLEEERNGYVITKFGTSDRNCW